MFWIRIKLTTQKNSNIKKIKHLKKIIKRGEIIAEWCFTSFLHSYLSCAFLVIELWLLLLPSIPLSHEYYFQAEEVYGAL